MKEMNCRLTVNAKAEKSIRNGHPWVYADDVVSSSGTYVSGDVVDVLNPKGKWLGAGFVNDVSQIRVRVFCRDANQSYDEKYWERRIRYAVEYRKTVMSGDLSCCRLIFGEADQFPGWTVDKFGSVIVTEVLSLGIEQRKDMLFRLLIRVLSESGENVSCIYERNDSPLREKEGMAVHTGYFHFPGESASPDGKTLITENGLRFEVDYVHGQKTGFFLDQKFNRDSVRRIAGGKRVLDCCTHTGAFALNALAGGASAATALDCSEDALNSARRNASLNGMEDRIGFVCADMFDYLEEQLKKGGSPYDLIILDPPAFTKSAKTVQNAFSGYKRLNTLAMRLLPRGGYLATCSCSHFMTDGLFRTMLSESAAAASVQLRQIEGRKQSPDHPVLWNVPETEYLKFYLFQVI